MFLRWLESVSHGLTEVSRILGEIFNSLGSILIHAALFATFVYGLWSFVTWCHGH